MRRRLPLLCAATIMLTSAITELPAAHADPPKPIPIKPPHVVAPAMTELPLGSVDRPAVGARVDAAGPGTRTTARRLTLSKASTRAFSLVGVTWTKDPAVGAVRIALRHRTAAGTWTAAEPFGRGDAGPDAAREVGVGRDGSDPIWTGRSTGVEVTVSATGVAPRDVRLTLVDPGDSAADAAPGSPVTAPAAAVPNAAPTAARPRIYTRAQWGADPRLMGWTPEYSPTIVAGFVHHTVDSNNYAAGDVPRILRAIYAFHSRTRGWGDIGYNFIVDKFGRIWEGRAGGINSTVIGAHTGGFNAGTFGVSMLGTYSTAAVPSAVVTSIAKVFAWKLATHYRNPNGLVRLRSAGGGTSRYPKGTLVTKSVISGHRDVGATDCPGGKGYAQLPNIRRLAFGYMGTGLVDPRATANTLLAGSGARPRVTAGLLRFSNWSVTLSLPCQGVVVRRYTGRGTKVDVTWDLRTQAGAPARPGNYDLTVQAAYGSATAVPVRTYVRYQSRATASAPADGAQPDAGPAGYVPITPIRVLDSRRSLGGAGAVPLTAGGRVDVPVTGVGTIPASGVAAVAVQTGSSCATADNFVVMWPAGTAQPVGSALTVNRPTLGGLSVVGVGAGGKISVSVLRPQTDVIAEVVGYYPVGGANGFHPVGRRLWDSGAANPVRPGETRTLDVPALSGGTVPAGAAVSLNVAANAPAGTGVLRVWPAGGAKPAGATVTYARGYRESTHAQPALGAGGRLAVSNDGAAPVRVLIDLDGWYGPGGDAFTVLPRTRLADTATGLGGRTGSLGPGVSFAVPVAGVAGVPAGATSVLLQVSGFSDRATYLAVHPAGQAAPGTEALTVQPGKWWSNTAASAIGAGGAVTVANGRGTTRVVVDVIGYFR